MKSDGSRSASSSGVPPISWRRLSAVALATALPHVDRRAELPEQLVDPPERAAGVGVDRGLSVGLHELLPPAPEPREPEQRVARVPGAILDHPLAPLAAELFDGEELEAGRRGALLERSCVHALRDDGDGLVELHGLARLEELRRNRHVGEHPAAGPEDSRALAYPLRLVDVGEDVAAPDPVDGGVGERERLDLRLN